MKRVFEIALGILTAIGGFVDIGELVASINYLLWVPVVAFLVWVVVWKLNFEVMENAFGLSGLALVVTGIAVWQLRPDWGNVAHQVLHPAKPGTESVASYFYYAIA